MSRPPPQRSRAPALTLPTVLVVGMDESLLGKCQHAASKAFATTRTCSLEAVRDLAGSLQPLALVVAKDVFEFSPVELQRLARSVRAGLVILEDGLTQDETDNDIAEAIADALRMRSASVTSYAVFADPITERTRRETPSRAPAPVERAGLRDAPLKPLVPGGSGVRLKPRMPAPLPIEDDSSAPDLPLPASWKKR